MTGAPFEKLETFQFSFRSSEILSSLYLFPLIMFLFSFAQAEFQFYKLPFSIHTDRHQCQAFGARLADKTLDFRFFEEQFSWPGRIMIIYPSCMDVRRNMGISQIQFIAPDSDKAFLEADMAGFYGFHLVAGQNQTGLVFLQDFIVKISAFIKGQNRHDISLAFIAVVTNADLRKIGIYVIIMAGDNYPKIKIWALSAGITATG